MSIELITFVINFHVEDRNFFYLYILESKKLLFMELVEVATFNFPEDACVLESILQEENIQYFLNNENMSVVLSPGIACSLMVNEEDKERTIEIIKKAGFERFLSE
jgi:hypothetical protein